MAMDLSFFGNLHRAARVAFKRAGYVWETRSTGAVKLGVWRARLNAKGSRRLVVAPGFGDTPLSWLPVLAMLRPVLPKEYDEIVLVDFPGFHGFLAKEKVVPSLDLLFQAYGDLLDGFKPQAVIGHSLGGWLTAQYAVSCGEGARPQPRTRHYGGPELIILCSPSGVFGPVKEWQDFLGKFENAVRNGFDSFLPHIFLKVPPWFSVLKREFAPFLQREDTVQFMRSIGANHHLDQRLSAIQSRVWLVWGAEDRLTPARWADHWVAGLKPGQGHAVLLKGTGHSLQLERPAVTAAVIGQILLQGKPQSIGNLFYKVSATPSIAPN
jgi:pimeloyl-ACP methyl ester carboxylesterase